MGMKSEASISFFTRLGELMMFLYKFKMFRIEEISEVAVNGWKSRGHYHPSLDNIVMNILFILLFIWIGSMGAIYFFYEQPGESMSAYAPRWVTYTYITYSALLVIWLMFVWSVIADSSDNGVCFLHHYCTLCHLLDRGKEEVAILNETDLKAFARKSLGELGQKLIDAEHKYGLYSQEQINIKETFESSYQACLAFALIENKGYAAFIPNVK